MVRGPQLRAADGTRRPAVFVWAALALLVLLIPAVTPELLPHTDDGCEVEVHCIACRLAYSPGAPVDAVQVHAPGERIEDVSLPPAAGPVETEVDVRSSRGPPAA